MEEVVNTLGSSGFDVDWSPVQQLPEEELRHATVANALGSSVGSRSRSPGRQSPAEELPPPARRTDAVAHASPLLPSPIPSAGSSPRPAAAALPHAESRRAVMLGGFRTEAFNAIFVENRRAEFRMNGHATYWSADDWFLYYSPGTRTWGVARASRFARVRAGQSYGSAHSPPSYDLLYDARLSPPMGWKESARQEPCELEAPRRRPAEPGRSAGAASAQPGGARRWAAAAAAGGQRVAGRARRAAAGRGAQGRRGSLAARGARGPLLARRARGRLSAVAGRVGGLPGQ
ncbi:unnamed protein product, partial [Prorocentrum cordatum]